MAGVNEAPSGSSELGENVQSNFELMEKHGWTSLAQAKHAPERDDRRVSLINEYPRARIMETEDDRRTVSSDPAVVAAVYYGFEITTGLMPFPELLSHKPDSSSEHERADQRLGAAVAAELVAASKLYANLKIDRHVRGASLQRLQQNAEEFTKDYYASNTPVLAALQIMSSPNAFRRLLNRDIVREAEYVIRMFMAKELGRIEEYSDLLKPIFPPETAEPTEE